MFFRLRFFIGKTYMFERRNLSNNLFCHVLLDFEKKRLKIDNFDGIHMKLLNLELFISKALTVSCIFSISTFSLLSRILALPPPPLG